MRSFFRRNASNNNQQTVTEGVGGNNNNNRQFHQQCETLIPAEIRMISGCHSEQTSADVSNVNAVAELPNPAGRAGGACTSALLEILYRNANNERGYVTNGRQALTFQDLLLELRASLSQKGMSQIPQLTSSRPLELERTAFSLVCGGGRRRAVLVGINYRGQNGELSGCHNDVFNVKQYIMKHHGYPNHDITVLIDDGRHGYPTRQKIIAALRQLVAESKAGDSIYFHYSGHGGLISPEWNAFKTGTDQYDETLYPVDHERAGQIRDFSLFNHFVKPMAAGVTVTCVMDCCHSGSVLELPFSFQPTPGGQIRMRENMSSLENLAFLYILAGGIMPHGFGNVTANIQNSVDGDLDAYQGTAIEEMQEADMEDYGEFDDYLPPEENFDVADEYGGYGDTADATAAFDPDADADADAPVVVQGTDPYGDMDADVHLPGDMDADDDAPIVVQGAEAFGVGPDVQGYSMAGEESEALARGDAFGGGDDDAVPENYGFGGVGDFFQGGGGSGGEEVVVEDVGDDGVGVDCGCFSDILGALAEQEEE